MIICECHLSLCNYAIKTIHSKAGHPFRNGSDSVEEHVVWRLATNAEYCTLSALFGVGILIVMETCSAICQHLMPLYVKIPMGSKKFLMVS